MQGVMVTVWVVERGERKMSELETKTTDEISDDAVDRREAALPKLILQNKRWVSLDSVKARDAQRKETNAKLRGNLLFLKKRFLKGGSYSQFDLEAVNGALLLVDGENMLNGGGENGIDRLSFAGLLASLYESARSSCKRSQKKALVAAWEAEAKTK